MSPDCNDIKGRLLADEQVLRALPTESAQAATREHLVSLLTPVSNPHRFRLQDVFNLDEIQEIQDAFACATGVASIITDPQGSPVTRPSNFSRLCSLIRKTPTGLQDCLHFNASLGHPVPQGYSAGHCPGCGLSNAGTPIMIGDHHLGNWLIGQAWDESVDQDKLLAYCAQIGVDEQDTQDALREVSRMPAAQFARIAQALHLVSQQLSRMAMQNVQQARSIIEREEAQISLRRVNRLYAVVSRINQAAIHSENTEAYIQAACHSIVTEGEFALAWFGAIKSDSLLYPLATAGDDTGYLSAAMAALNERRCCENVVLQVTLECRAMIINDTGRNPGDDPWIRLAQERGFPAMAILPVKTTSGGACEVIAVYAYEPDFFNEREIHLLEEFVSDFTFALESFRRESERQTAELARQESEMLYRSLVENSPDVVMLLHAGRMRFVNQAAAKILTQGKPSSLIGQDLLPYFHPNDRNLMARRCYQPEPGSESTNSEVRILKADGKSVTLEMKFIPVVHHADPCVLCIGHDITERIESEQRIQAKIDHLYALRAIDAAINSDMPLEEVICLILEKAREQLHVESASAWLLDSATGQLLPTASCGYIDAQPAPLLVHFEDEAYFAVMVERRNYETNDFSNAPIRLSPCGQMYHTYMVTPLVIKGEMRGILELLSCEALQHDRDWSEFFEILTGQAAVAISSAELLENLRTTNTELSDAYDTTIEGLAHALDLRDQETEGHSRRVTDMTVRLAERMGFHAEEIVHLRRGALLHDIGKVGIPDAILLKPGPLTDEEWEIMRRHPQYAYELLNPIAFLRPAIQIPYYHHERWNGQGYPFKLRETEIPLAARIFAVVDVWDALQSDRPYRKGWPQQKIYDYLEAQSGIQFDPNVVQIFLDVLRNPEEAKGGLIVDIPPFDQMPTL